MMIVFEGTSSTREWPGLLTLDSQPTSLTNEEAKQVRLSIFMSVFSYE